MKQKALRLLMCMVLSIGLVISPKYGSVQTVNAAGTIQAAIYGWFDQKLAYDVLDVVNARRRENGLAELKMDEDLLSAAMMRAAETYILFSHTRPNGESCFSACSKMFGENIALGSDNAEDVMRRWMNSDGHRGNILGSYSTVGIGVFWAEGTYFWVQCFGRGTQKEVTSNYQGYGVVSFPVSGSFAETRLENSDFTIVKHRTVRPSIVLAEKCYMHPSAYNWSSSNTSVATVDENGLITGAASGTAVITGTNKLDSDNAYQITITVVDGMWHQDNYGWWYDEGDSYPQNQFKKIGSKTYYFNNNGYIVTGWQKISGDYYFFDSLGAMKTNAWEGNYYLLEDGRMAKNRWVDNEQYYVGADGKWIPNYGTAHWESNSTGWWYVREDGTYPANTFEEINGKTYYFNAGGYMVTGWKSVDGEYYFFETSGAMKTNAWEGNYYLLADGRMARDQWVDNNKYYVDKTGKWHQAHWESNSTGWWYVNEDTTYPVSEFKEIGGKTYYFDERGYMAVGWKQVGGEYYFFETSGAMKTNAWEGNYYLLEDGKMAKDQWVDNDKYYVDETGKWVPGA